MVGGAADRGQEQAKVEVLSLFQEKGKPLTLCKEWKEVMRFAFWSDHSGYDVENESEV